MDSSSPQLIKKIEEMQKTVLAMIGVLVFAHASVVCAQSLKGSHRTMTHQNTVARNLDYTFLRTSSQVRRFAEDGLLVPVRSTQSMKVSEGVSFAYARPAVKLFAERLSRQYQAECGERMVVTSLTRPLSRQPWNASELSVHPAGMALDIRVSDRRACRKWLAAALIDLEAKGVIDATREHYPAHFHVAVFPEPYERYVASLDGTSATQLAANPDAPTPGTEKKLRIAPEQQPTYASMIPLPSPRTSTHKVRPGESLWSIAKSHGVTVTALKNANDLHRSKIVPGQVLAIPRARSSEAD